MPDNYAKISSGLGEFHPMNIVVLPILFEGEVKAVMELSSVERFSPAHQAFLDQLTESIGIVLNTIEASTRTENLLKQSQSLATELQKTNLELEEKARSNLAKDQFLAMLSHELRTPLTPVLASALELENEPDVRPDVRESLQMIRRNVELEARLIDDLLDLTRIDRGKVQLNFEIVDAHTLLQNALEICQPEIDRKTSDAVPQSRREKSAYASRPGATAANLLEPDQQRGEIHAAKRANHRLPPATIPGGQLRVEIADTGHGD